MEVSHHRFYRYDSESGDSDKSICSSVHVHGIHDVGHGGGKVSDKLCPLYLPHMVWEPGCYLIEILVGVEL